MKTSLKTLLTAAFTAIVLSATVFNSTANTKTIMLEKASAHADIKKVVVTGNIKVLLVQSTREWVEVEDDKDQVSIKLQGNTLLISSWEKTPATVIVYVKDAYRIDASNTSSVSTVGRFKVKNLQLILRDQASARVKVDAESLYTIIGDHAKLELLGSTEEHMIRSNGVAKLKMDNFAAIKTNREPIGNDIVLNNKTARRTN